MCRSWVVIMFPPWKSMISDHPLASLALLVYDILGIEALRLIWELVKTLPFLVIHFALNFFKSKTLFYSQHFPFPFPLSKSLEPIHLDPPFSSNHDREQREKEKFKFCEERLSTRNDTAMPTAVSCRQPLPTIQWRIQKF